MPVITKLIGPGCAVPRPFGKAARLVREWVMLLIGKRPKRFIANKNTIAIAALFGTGRAKLQVVFTVVFVHPGAFNKGQQEHVIIVLTKAFPAMLFGIKL